MGRFGILLLASIPIAAAVLLVSSSQPLKAPLWTNSRITELDRDRSVLRGLEFIYASASKPKQFEAFGDDFLWCFYSLSAAASDPELKKRALRMGRERAKEWRKANSSVPLEANADAIANLAFGSLSADLLDVRDPGMKTELRTAALLHKPEEYFQFNPTLEPPPNDIPIDCAKCKSSNPRGSKVCRKCAAELRMTDPYDILCDALITAYIGNRYGVTLGGSYEDVAQWIPKMRPYPRHNKDDLRPTYGADYAVTHIVYTLNDYTLYKLRPEWLPQEYEYLKTNLRANIAMSDAETLGEYMDALRSFGMDESDPIMRAGVEFLLAHQNPDGSWGDVREADPYVRYHATWTSMNGIMQYAWRGERVSSPEALRRIHAGDR